MRLAAAMVALLVLSSTAQGIRPKGGNARFAKLAKRAGIKAQYLKSNTFALKIPGVSQTVYFNRGPKKQITLEGPSLNLVRGIIGRLPSEAYGTSTGQMVFPGIVVHKITLNPGTRLKTVIKALTPKKQEKKR